MSPNNCSMALIGLGYWGKNVLRNLWELGVLKVACDLNPEVVRSRQADYPQLEFVTSVEEVLRREDIQAVAIATPAATHYSLAKRFLESNFDVFVEKPLCLHVEEGRELVEVAEKNQRVLMVGHVLQYHPAVKKLKELLAQGQLGKIQYIYSNRLNIGKLRTEENILWSFAPHDISIILSLTGYQTPQVQTFGGDYISSGVYDTTITTLDFPNGIKAHIFVSWLHPFKEQKLVVVGSKSMAVFDDTSEDKLLLYPHRIEWEDGKIPRALKADYEKVPLEDVEPLKEEMRHFVESVQNRKPPLTDGKEGLAVLTVLQEAESQLLSSFSPPSEEEKNYFVHSSSTIDEGVIIGRGSKVWHYSHLLKGTTLGEECIVGQNVMIGPEVEIGNRCKIQNNVSVYKGVTLEEEVFCGPSCVFTNVYNPRAFVERKDEFRPTLVRRGATIGANATILCGVEIGRYAMIGAGAVVREDVPSYAIVVGVPSRQIGWICKCGVRLEMAGHEGRCPACENTYGLEEGKLVPYREI